MIFVFEGIKIKGIFVTVQRFSEQDIVSSISHTNCDLEKEREQKNKSPLECVLYSANFTIGDLRLSQACMGIWQGCAIFAKIRRD